MAEVNLKVESRELLSKGLKALSEGKTPSALRYFEKAVEIEENPVSSSYLAFCIAKERGQIKKAISILEEAIKKEPENSLIYLNLGRVYLLSGKKPEAITMFRTGLSYEKNQEIINELESLGIRKPPPIRFLKRENLINRYLGILLKKLGYR